MAAERSGFGLVDRAIDDFSRANRRANLFFGISNPNGDGAPLRYVEGEFSVVMRNFRPMKSLEYFVYCVY
jgi:hypothetical protein